jgi:D-serine deaminase-like pyridoxal phosphate-dependent protein
MPQLAPLQSAQLATIATPALIIDGQKVDRNLRRMADYARRHQLQLRPHTKTHKSLFLAAKQLEAGPCAGLTVAKVGEAEVLKSATNSIMIAYPTVDRARTDAIAELAHSGNIVVAVDSAFAVDALSDSASRAGSTVGVLVDLDVGFHRTGLQTVEQSLDLAQHIDRASGLALNGLFIYPGHVTGSTEQRHAAMSRVAELVDDAHHRWQQAGLAMPIVSGGTTPSAFDSHLVPHTTEIRPGTYIFNDLNIWRGGYCELDDCAATIVATVVSNAVPGKVILDAGSKTLTSDRCGPAPDSGHGYIVEHPEAMIISRCEAHPRLGERVTIVPNHICPCVNLQTQIWFREASDSEELQAICVDARGRLS